MKTNLISVVATTAVMALFLSCDGPDYIGEENGHEYVNLDLPSGTMWARCNIGAVRASENGNYYAWAETCTKTSYSYSTYFYMDDNNNSWKGFTKYTIPDGQFSGIWYENGVFCGDRKTKLEDGDDVAFQSWGGKWRVPTNLQLAELKNECYWVYTTNYNDSGVEGFIVYKAKTNSDKGKNSKTSTPSGSYDISYDANIFLPLSGYRDNLNLNRAESEGNLWSSSLSEEYTDYADFLNYTYYGSVSVSSLERTYGLNIRAVCVNPDDAAE